MNRTLGRAALRLAPFLLALLAAAQTKEQARESERARQMMAAGQFEQAIPVYQRLVAALPGNPGLLLDLALAEHMAGHEREAIPHLEAFLKLQPDVPGALLSLGAAHLALNAPREAIPPLEKVVAREPQNRDARGMLAGALMAVGRFDRAGVEYREMSDRFPDDPKAWYGLGMSYQSLAGAAFERLQKADPKSPYVAALVAGTRVQRRQYRSAFFFYSEALRQVPGLHGIHTAMADIYRKTGHPEWAVEEEAKERALAAPDCAAHPDECRFLAGKDVELTVLPRAAAPAPEALYWQAMAANELALQAFFRLGQLPASVELHQLKAEIARGQNQHLEAVREWRAALELSPGNPRLEHQLAVSLFMAADYQAAFDQAVRLLKADPRSPDLNFMAGDSLLRLERPEPALPFLRAALEADPSLRAADASLGLALSRLGRNREAVPHLEQALELDDDGSLHYQLARAYQASGSQGKARATMAEYQEIVKRNQQVRNEVAREAQIGPPR